MRQFSIHKVNKPMMRRKEGATADQGDSESLKQPGSSGFVGGDFDAAGEITGATIGMSGSIAGRHEFHIGGEQPSLLTREEQEALQPKEIKVVNPWIHEATHKEYLESVKVGTLLAT
jgi:hypothetical protein